MAEAEYRIVRQPNGLFRVEHSGDKAKLFTTETVAQAYIKVQMNLAEAGERWRQTPLGSLLNPD
jgi:hypothetical protein